MAVITDLLAHKQIMKEFNLTYQQTYIISTVEQLHLKGQLTTKRDLMHAFGQNFATNKLTNDLIVLRELGYITLNSKKRGQRTPMHFYSPGKKSVILGERYKELCYEYSGSRF
jgi:hypothetical protein